MSKLLVVEDSKFFSSLIKRTVEARLNIDVLCAFTRAEAIALVDEWGDEIFLALVDLHLPDAADGETIDDFQKMEIPSVVFTGQYSDELRFRMLAKGVIDYVVKENPSSLDYVVSLVRRIHRNPSIKTIVAEDSRTARLFISNLLKLHKYNVLEAGDGAEALELLEENEDVKLIITDFNMPGMDGFELTKRVRSKFRKSELAIIGMSAQGNNTLSAKFIKNGANDFITKPFLDEEFFCRVSQNIDMIEQMHELHYAATMDFLTGVNNRRSFFDFANGAFKKSKKASSPAIVGMMDIDFFKKVNDTYGHDGGDVVLREVAGVFREHVGKDDIIARFGGEEFCIYSNSLTAETAFDYFDGIRKSIEARKINTGNEEIGITISIGVCCEKTETLDDMIIRADENLYEAKESGRNRVVL